MELTRSLEVLPNYVQELKSEVAHKNYMNNKYFSQSAFDGAVERIRILEEGSRRKNICITGLPKYENFEQIHTERNKLVNMTNLGW